MNEIEEALREIKRRQAQTSDAVELLQLVSINIQKMVCSLDRIRKPRIIHVPRLTLFAKIMLSLFTAAYVFDHIFNWLNL